MNLRDRLEVWALNFTGGRITPLSDREKQSVAALLREAAAALPVGDG